MDESASEIARLRAALAASEARAASAEADLAQVRAVVTTSEAMIRHLKLEIAKLRRAQYGQSSERRARLIEQMELELEELEADATEDEIAAERAAAKITNVSAFQRRRPARKPFPEHLPRERLVIEAPSTCTCCGSARIVKMGEDITETLEVIPRQWKVIQTVREKFTCRDCEKISQPPAPFHATPRGWAGPNLLATILFEKFGQHQPLNRQAERYAREGVDLSLSTLADQVGACATALQPIHDLIRAHVLAAERLHGDDTTVPLLARGATRQARPWTYVRDDRPFAGGAPPAALFYFSPDREKIHPNRHLAGWQGTLQADAYGGYNDLYRADRSPAPVLSGRQALSDEQCRRTRPSRCRSGAKGMALRRVAARRSSRRVHVFADRHRKNERYRPAGLAGGCPRPDREHPRIQAAGTVTMELVPRRKRSTGGGLMARPTHVYTIEYVATLIGENLELLQEVASNSDNIDYGEMIHAYNGTEEGITTFTDRGIESLQEFLADVRTWEGGVRQFLIESQCDPERIERIMADVPKS